MNRNVPLLYAFNFLTDFRLYGPFLIIYFSEVSGSYTLGMSVFAITRIVSALLEVPTGIWSDRVGRRKTIIWGAWFSFLAVFAYAAAPGAIILLLGGALEGVARSLYSGNNAALLYDSLAEDGEESNYHHYFGRMSSFLQIALAISALLGGLAGLYSLQLVMWLSVPPQLAAFALAFYFKEPVHVREHVADSLSHLWTALKHLKDSPRLMWLTAAQSISHGFGEANYQFTKAFYILLWPLWAMGILQALANVLAAIGFWIAGRVIDRFRHLQVLIFCSVLGQAFNLTGLALANVLSPVIMQGPSMLYGLSTTARDHLLQESFTDEQRATLGSIVAIVGSVVFTFAALFIGGVADLYSERVALVTALLIQMVVIPIYVKLFREA